MQWHDGAQNEQNVYNWKSENWKANHGWTSQTFLILPPPSPQQKLWNTVEPHYNEVLGTMKITLLYQVSHYIG